MECDARLGVVQQGAQAAHLCFAQERPVEEVGRKLDGDLAHVAAGVVVVFPSVLYLRPYEHEVVGGKFLNAVAYDAPCAFAVGHKIEFVFLMAVYGVVESGFVAVDEIKTVAVA